MKARCKKLTTLMATAMAIVLLVPTVAFAAGITRDNFDAKRYADTYADLKAAYGYNEDQLWAHYQAFGIKEGRQVYAKGSSAPAAGITRDNFDAKRYADTYADLKAAFGYNEEQLWTHYQMFGIKEGRQVYAKGASAPAAAPAQQTAQAPAAQPAPAQTGSMSDPQWVFNQISGAAAAHGFTCAIAGNQIDLCAIDLNRKWQILDFVHIGGGTWNIGGWTNFFDDYHEVNVSSINEMLSFIASHAH